MHVPRSSTRLTVSAGIHPSSSPTSPPPVRVRKGAQPAAFASSLDPSERRDFGVRDALALTGPDAALPQEVYVNLEPEPVRVRVRGGWGIADSWDVAGPLLRARVLAAIGPLLAAGWQLDGTFAAAARWDVSVASGPDLYRGCWVRLQHSAQPANGKTAR